VSVATVAEIPEDLKDLRRWPVWRLEERDGKLTKVPYSPLTGRKASSTDPDTWGSYFEAIKAYTEGGYDGVGFVFSPEDGISGIDLDDCRDPETGELEPWAADIVRDIGSYAEVSPSGRGVHIIARGELPPGGRRKGKVEMYDRGRFFTMTGRRLADTPATVNERQHELVRLHRRLFGEPATSEAADARRTPPAGGFAGDDRELLERAMRAHNGEKFRRLWAGDRSGYPSGSESDLALVSHLAFWTGGDRERIDRLFRASGLYREKWERADYRERTISTALSQAEFYRPEGAAAPLRSVGTGRTAEGLPDGGEDPPSTNGRGAGDGRGAPGFNLTDLGNSERFAADHGEDVRYCYPWRQWLVWTGARWERDDAGRVHRLAKETVRGIYREAAAAEDEGRRKALARHATGSEAEARIRAMLELAKSELPVSPDELDDDPWLLNAQNGTIDLRSGDLHAHRREDLITRLAPARFDPAARSDTWDRFLSAATKGKDGLAAFLGRAVGYSLTGDMGEKVLFFIHGPKDAGKTTFLEAVKAALGDYSDTIAFDALLDRGQRGGPRPDIAQLPGKRFVASSEVKEGSKMAVEVVKALTGWDELNVRNVYERPFSFVPQCKLWLAANHAPSVPVDDDATWDRILRIPFENAVPKDRRDPGVQRALRDPGQSGAAILAWAVRGCAEWRRDGLGVPSVVKAATDEYREDMDPLRDFIAAYCILGSAYWTPSGQLRDAYDKWVKETAEPNVLRGKKWGASLRAHGCEPDTTPDKKSRIWKGIALRNGPGDDYEGGQIPSGSSARTDSAGVAQTPANITETRTFSDGLGSESESFARNPSHEEDFQTNPSESVRRQESVRDQHVALAAGEDLQERHAAPSSGNPGRRLTPAEAEEVKRLMREGMDPALARAAVLGEAADLLEQGAS
jgi:putative DNA primase/helicase